MREQQLKGIGGWLLFYIVFAFISATQLIIIGFLTIKLFMSFLPFAMIIFGGFWLYTICMVILKRKKAINMTIYLLCVGIVISIAGEVFSLLSSNGAYSFFDNFKFLIGTIIYIIFIFYFKNSLRVKNTLVK